METTPIGKPNDVNLPFFAYGIFKPGQIAYYKIKNYIQEQPLEEEVCYEMWYRDGIPTLCGEKSDTHKTWGYLIYFDNPEKAYEIIGKAKTEELYQWKIIDVNGEDAYTLVGRDMPNGCFRNWDNPFSNYDYRQDSFFAVAKKQIRDCVNDYKDKEDIDMKDFFIIQMHYMLLWSVIERFCTLKYGNFYKTAFAKERAFKNKLKTIGRKDVVYSSDTLEDHELDPNDYHSIFYYYTIRCNVVHKGKIVENKDYLKIKYALKELYELFDVVYEETLNRNRNDLRNMH